MDELGLLSYAGDFRSEAVEASRVMLLDVAGDIEALPVSTCTRIAEEGDPIAPKTLQKMAYAVWLELGLIGLTLLSFIAGIMGEQIAFIIASLVIAVFALVLLLVLIVRRSVWMRRIVAARGMPIGPGARCVNIENALTYSRMKLAPEDLAMLWIDPERHCLRLEGLGHRYIIYAADVMSLSLRRAPGQASTSVTYRVGTVQLALTLSENQGNLLEILKQALGLNPRLHPALMSALGGGGEIVDAVGAP